MAIDATRCVGRAGSDSSLLKYATDVLIAEQVVY